MSMAEGGGGGRARGGARRAAAGRRSSQHKSSSSMAEPGLCTDGASTGGFDAPANLQLRPHPVFSCQT
jgi:hypothetical protein